MCNGKIHKERGGILSRKIYKFHVKQLLAKHFWVVTLLNTRFFRKNLIPRSVKTNKNLFISTYHSCKEVLFCPSSLIHQTQLSVYALLLSLIVACSVALNATAQEQTVTLAFYQGLNLKQDAVVSTPEVIAVVFCGTATEPFFPALDRCGGLSGERTEVTHQVTSERMSSFC